MRSRIRSEELEARQNATRPDEETEEPETSAETDEGDLEDADDDRWDVFILDDDGEPLPEYGDFWFPD